MAADHRHTEAGQLEEPDGIPHLGFDHWNQTGMFFLRLSAGGPAPDLDLLLSLGLLLHSTPLLPASVNNLDTAGIHERL